MSENRAPSEGVQVCVIGAGPAGSLVANRLAETNHTVVVLEAGKQFASNEQVDRLDRMERSLRPSFHSSAVWDMEEERDKYTNSGEIAYPLNQKRVKGVGGSTLHWGGRVARFPPKDFEMETRYGIASDWPIGYEDLREYYAAAEREFGVAGADDNPFMPPREEAYPMDAFPPSYSDSLFVNACEKIGIQTHSVPNARNSRSYDGRSPCVGYGTCNPVCPSGAKYSADVHVAQAEQHGARVIDRAVVRQLEHDADGEEVTAAVYQTPSGKVYRQQAEYFVLAAGAVENARLLLLSRSERYPNGLANSSGLVGRYFMEHPYVGVIGRLSQPIEQHQIGFGTTESYHFYEPDDPPPGSFKLEFSNEAGPRITELALAQRTPLVDTSRALSDPSAVNLGELAENAQPIEWGDELAETIRSQHGRFFKLMAEIEPLPNPSNRVTLNENEVDKFGDPIPDITWSPGEYSERTVERAFEVIERIVDHMEIDVQEMERQTFWGGAGHSAGTTRMGADSMAGVVDENLRTYDLQNFYIAGASTFVTLGASQPTLTIAATALRLADHLVEDVI